MSNQIATPRRVNFYQNPEDARCVLMATFGWGNKAIIRQTGLTISQISYRLRTFERRRPPSQLLTSRKAYRDGVGPAAKAMISMVSEKRLSQIVTDSLRKRGLLKLKP